MEEVKYTLKRRKGQKNLRMRFTDSGELVVSVPYSMPQAGIDRFVEEKKDWIERQMARFSQHSYDTGDSLPFWGRQCLLLVIKGRERSVRYGSGSLLVCVPHPENKNTVKRELYGFYGTELYKYAFMRVNYWCSVMQIAVPKVEICNAKTRWGVCYASRGLVRFSAITATLPEDLIDLIVVHELCHFRYQDHSAGFKAQMSKYLPDAKERNARLKELDRKGLHRNLF